MVNVIPFIDFFLFVVVGSHTGTIEHVLAFIVAVLQSLVTFQSKNAEKQVTPLASCDIKRKSECDYLLKSKARKS